MTLNLYLSTICSCLGQWKCVDLSKEQDQAINNEGTHTLLSLSGSVYFQSKDSVAPENTPPFCRSPPTPARWATGHCTAHRNSFALCSWAWKRRRRSRNAIVRCQKWNCTRTLGSFCPQSYLQVTVSTLKTWKWKLNVSENRRSTFFSVTNKNMLILD